LISSKFGGSHETNQCDLSLRFSTEIEISQQIELKS
jgi:hypothetical protein